MGWCLQAALNLGREEEGTGGWAGSHFCLGEHPTSPDTSWFFCLCCPGGAAALQQHSLALLSAGAQREPEPPPASAAGAGLCLLPHLRAQALGDVQGPQLCCKRDRNLKMSAEMVTKSSGKCWLGCCSWVVCGERFQAPHVSFCLASFDMLLAFNREHTPSSAQAADVFQGFGISPFLRSPPREFKVSWPPCF